MELAAGDRVDRYVLRVRLGEGGQGEVWRADDPIDAEHPKAVKLVGVASATPNQLERLRREARRLVQLKHPSLIACHGLFEDLHRDLLGVVMEYADGQSLDDAMADARMTEDKRMLVLAHVAGALAYVHQRNVVHRDIKLENVVVTHAFWDAPQDPRTVKLIDFGIAVESDNPKPLTQIGCVIGTPPYLAPELIDPSGWNSVGGATPTSDVFAFGVLAWKLLLGASAHPSGLPGRSNMGEYAVAYRASAGGRWPPETPQAVWVPVIAHCLALDPRSRVKDGLELVSELAKAMPGVILPTAEQAAPTPVAGEKRPATAPPTVHVGGAGPHTETAVAPAPLRASMPQPSVRTVPQAPDVARWSPRPQYTSEPVVQPTPEVAPHYAHAMRRRRWPSVLGALFVVGSGVVTLAVAVAWYAGLLPDLDALQDSPSAGAPVATESSPTLAPVKTAKVPPPADTVPSRESRSAFCKRCPSGLDCEPGCKHLLASEYNLRLWNVSTLADRMGVRLDFTVCVTRLRDHGTACFNNADTRESYIPLEKLTVTPADLTSNGLRISVFERIGTDVVPFATRNVVVYPHGVQRWALCQGLTVGGFDNKGVNWVSFYLDPIVNRPQTRVCYHE